MMDTVFYFVMGAMIGIGVGFSLPEWAQLTCAIVGFIMAVGTIGWYGHKMWESINEESE